MTKRTWIAPSTVTQLRIELLRLDLTQLDLAKRLDVPVSTLSSWLRGVSPPPPDLLRRIEHALDIPPNALACGGAQAPPPHPRQRHIGRLQSTPGGGVR